MKNSRKIFLSACVATMVASSAHAVVGGGIAFGDAQLTDKDKNGNYSFVVDKDTGSIYNITSIIGSSFDGKTNKHINHLNIDAAKSTFNLDGTMEAGIGVYKDKTNNDFKFYSFNIKAKEVLLNGWGAYLDVGNTGVIEGDLGLKGVNDFDRPDLSIYNGTLGSHSANGSLLVKGNFTADYADLYFYGNHGFHVTGKGNITNSNFNAYNAPVGENGIFLLSSDKGFNKNITTSNTAGVFKVIYVDNDRYFKILIGQTQNYVPDIGTSLIEIKGLDYKLATVGNSLYLQAKIDEATWKNIKSSEVSKNLIAAKIDALTKLAQEIRMQAGLPVPRNQQDPNAEIKKILDNIEAEIKRLEDPKNTTAFNAQVDAVLASLLRSDRQQAAGSALVDAMVGNAEQARNVVDSARESANNSNRQGAIQVINLANEMAISTRIMQPRSQGENSVWSNAFGGANMVGSENDSVFGITLGIDRQFSDSILFGAYLTYADSKLSHKSINQDADNLQFGAYSRIANNNHEFDIKAYAQFSYADQERFLNGSTQKSDYTQTYLGASGVYGYVFDMGNDFAIKPLVGLNLYYSNTPDYTESGVWAQHVQSMSSFAASAELGAEFRKAFGNGFFYITPKVEQFFATSGDDFTARFTGSDINYNVAGAEKDKTFGKLIAGSNFNITDNLSLDVSVGVKQILANKDDDTDETYLSGNIGVKYSF